MQTGIRLQAHPTDEQATVFSGWIGCSRVVWNAKCDEHAYLSAYSRKYMPIGTWAPVDQTYSQFKDEVLTPWLSDCPSQILRNAAVGWHRTKQNHMKGLCRQPRRKKRTDRGSVHLTSELFRFERCDDGVLRLFIGTKTNDLGHLSIKTHKPFEIPKSIRIVRETSGWYVSFSYETDEKAADAGITVFPSPEEQLAWLRQQPREWLEANVAGHDRGCAVPVHSADATYEFTPEQKEARKRSDRKTKRLQRRMARQKKGSNRRQIVKAKLAREKADQRNRRKDFCHKTSRKIVDAPATINVFENLKLANMTRRAKPKQDEATGKYLPNGASAKTALNRLLLEPGLGQLAEFTRYKSARAGKLLLFVPPHHTSQECARCGHVDADSRRTRALFECTSCGHRDDADRNAALIIAKRAVKLILDPGTGLSARGVLSKGTSSDTGRGAEGKTHGAIVAPDALGETRRTEKRRSAPRSAPRRKRQKRSGRRTPSRTKPEAEARSLGSE